MLSYVTETEIVELLQAMIQRTVGQSSGGYFGVRCGPG